MIATTLITNKEFLRMKSKIAVVALLLLPKTQANYGLAMKSHDKSKCLERGRFDNDCCSRKK